MLMLDLGLDYDKLYTQGLGDRICGLEAVLIVDGH